MTPYLKSAGHHQTSDDHRDQAPAKHEHQHQRCAISIADVREFDDARSALQHPDDRRDDDGIRCDPRWHRDGAERGNSGKLLLELAIMKRRSRICGTPNLAAFKTACCCLYPNAVKFGLHFVEEHAAFSVHDTLNILKDDVVGFSKSDYP